MQRGVSARRLHQIQVHGLAVASLLLRRHEPVRDVVEMPDDPRLESGLLAHLAQGCILGSLAFFAHTFRKCPHLFVLEVARPDQRDFRLVAVAPEDDPTERLRAPDGPRLRVGCRRG